MKRGIFLSIIFSQCKYTSPFRTKNETINTENKNMENSRSETLEPENQNKLFY